MRLYEVFSPNPTLPQIKSQIEDQLSDDLDDDEREELMRHHGYLDNMLFDEHGVLSIWRAMIVNPKWPASAKPGTSLGVYWSHDPSTAQAYDASHLLSKGNVSVMIMARLDAEYVDWETILELMERGENEVRLAPGTPLIVDTVWIDDEETTMPNWTDRKYMA